MGLLFKSKEPKAPIPQASAPTPVSSVDSSGQNFRGMIEAAIRAANLPGPDFLEFTDAVTKMTGTEEQKYKNVFIAYEGMGKTSAKLVEEGGKYLDVLEGLKKSFDDAMTTTTSIKITDKEARIKESKAKIEALNTQIQTENNSITSLTGEVSTARSDLAVKEAGFNAEYTNWKNKLQNYITNIKTYL